MVAEGRVRPNCLGSGGNFEGFGDPFRRSLNMRSLFYEVTKFEDVRHKVLT